MEIKTVNLQEKFATFSDHWHPRIVGGLNGQHVKIAKVQGEFVMHQHEQEDELFFVVEGTLFIRLEDKTLEIKQGEFVIIPKGTNHQPFAPEEVKLLLFEPQSTLNTGDLETDKTVRNLESI